MVLGQPATSQSLHNSDILFGFEGNLQRVALPVLRARLLVTPTVVVVLVADTSHVPVLRRSRLIHMRVRAERRSLRLDPLLFFNLLLLLNFCY